jgi:transposase
VMVMVHPNAAAIDIGATMHIAAVGADRTSEPVRCFGTFTTDLHRLADWFAECGVETVVMESTGVYWIPIFELLDERGVEVFLVNARDAKHVPGRKTDVSDAQWLQRLHSYGLLRASFRPKGEIAELRAYLRQRERLLDYAASHIQHMQKALTEMNVQLHHVVADITGATGMRIIRTIIPADATQLCWRYCATGAATRPLRIPAATHDPPIERAYFDVRAAQYVVLGKDLTQIHGLGPYLALKLVAECGEDLSAWPSAKHFTSWLCLAPSNKISGGKTLSSRTRRSGSRAAALSRLAAVAIGRTESAQDRGSVLQRHGMNYVDPGASYYETRYRERVIDNLHRHAKAFGFILQEVDKAGLPTLAYGPE